MFNAGLLTGVALLAALALFVAVVATRYGGGSLPRRIQRFALRQSLVITPDNQPQVVYYLVMTRRWRRALAILAVVLSVVFAGSSSGDVNLWWLFPGWFVGAVLVEWRVSGGVPGSRAAASLRPRQVTDYVDRTTLSAIAAVWTLVPPLAVAGLIATAAHRPRQRVDELLVLGTSALIIVGVGLVTRRVVNRPQPLAAPDIVHADNAIRSRSLNVLAGSMLALGGVQVTEAVTDGLLARESTASFVIIVIFGLAVPIVGVMVAMKPRRTPAFGMPYPVDA